MVLSTAERVDDFVDDLRLFSVVPAAVFPAGKPWRRIIRITMRPRVIGCDCSNCSRPHGRRGLSLPAFRPCCSPRRIPPRWPGTRDRCMWATRSTTRSSFPVGWSKPVFIPRRPWNCRAISPPRGDHRHLCDRLERPGPPGILRRSDRIDSGLRCGRPTKSGAVGGGRCDLAGAQHGRAAHWPIICPTTVGSRWSNCPISTRPAELSPAVRAGRAVPHGRGGSPPGSAVSVGHLGEHRGRLDGNDLSLADGVGGTVQRRHRPGPR